MESKIDSKSVQVQGVIEAFTSVKWTNVGDTVYTGRRDFNQKELQDIYNSIPFNALPYIQRYGQRLYIKRNHYDDVLDNLLASIPSLSYGFFKG